MVSEELSIVATDVRAPWFEAALAIKFISEIDIRFAVEKISQVQSWLHQMYGVDLEVSPVQCPIGRIVVINFAGAL